MKELGRSVLVLGSGAREHALAWKLRLEAPASKVWVWPGNDGIRSEGFSTPELKVSERVGYSWEAALGWASENQLDLVVVGPDQFLEEGVVDRGRELGLRMFGPTRSASRLEWSKLFMKEILQKAKVRTAEYFEVSSEETLLSHLSKSGPPEREIRNWVLKVDGLALGKGVWVGESLEDAVTFLRASLGRGEKLFLERRLTGREVSVFAITDGENCIFLPSARDHKRVGEKDEGPNTGGMGAVSPGDPNELSLHERVNREVLGPTLQTLQGLGVSYQGVLFCGLILDAENKLWVLEYNARFGDPETQAILPRIEEPLFPILKAASSERGFSGLSGFQNARTLKTSSETSLAVVMASQGYPSSAMRVGEDLTLGSSRGATTEIFYAGVKMGAHGRLQNHSGRVLTIQGKAHDLEQVRLKVYRELASRVRFPGMHYRRDIGSFANPPKLRLGILASGRGSNAQVVMEACRKGELPAEVALLVSSREKAQVLERAQALQVPTMVCQDAGLGLHEVLAQAAPIDFILCLGYMKILKPEFLDLWLDSEGQSRILNLHPSLLPKFPGAKAYEEIHQARETESGATLHRVTSDLDQGPKIAQSSYLVDPEWSLEDLKKRGLEFEHRFLLESLKKLWLSPFRGVQKGKVPSVVSN